MRSYQKRPERFENEKHKMPININQKIFERLQTLDEDIFLTFDGLLLASIFISKIYIYNNFTHTGASSPNNLNPIVAFIDFPLSHHFPLNATIKFDFILIDL